MKVVARTLEGESNLGGEKIGMTIDDAAMQHIMSVLTDLYSDPELAVIREYSTNALDSHVDAGVKRPIEVTLPSPLSPFFKVRDYGIGLDADDIREIYSRYGTSTKRDSNDVVGMLGLGCKSALTYTDQFTLVGIKDGRMVQVAISRDEDGGGSMTIVSDSPTDQPNGAEVIVPAKRHNAFEEKAFEFFKFWQPGTVTVNGEQPERVDGMWIDDRLCLAQNTNPVVVMGNVAYPIPEDATDQYGRRNMGEWKYGNYSRWYGTVAYVDIGDVQFTPSRESLQMTKHTKATLDRLKQEVQSKLDDSLAKQIENAATPNEAVRKMQEALAINTRMRDVLYQGRPVPKGALARDTRKRDGQGNVIAAGDDRDGFLTFGFSSYQRKTGEWSASIDIERACTAAWFVGFDGAELTPTKREKLDVFFTNKSIHPRPPMIFVRAMTSDEAFWTKGAKVYQWADVESIKITRTTKVIDANGRPRGSYIGYRAGKWQDIPADTIDTTKPVLWNHGNRWALEGAREWRSGLCPADATVLTMPANRIDKFKRDFPMALQMREYVEKQAKVWLASVSQDDLEAAKFQRTYPGVLDKFDEAKVDDPALKRHIRMAKRNVTTVTKKIGALSNWMPASASGQSSEKHPFTKYPLLLAGRGYGEPRLNLDHAYLYINAAYAAERKGQ